MSVVSCLSHVYAVALNRPFHGPHYRLQGLFIGQPVVVADDERVGVMT